MLSVFFSLNTKLDSEVDNFFFLNYLMKQSDYLIIQPPHLV